jgi:hypothetical protein
MGGSESKPVGFEADKLDGALTKRDLVNWMEHKKSAKYWGFPWLSGVATLFSTLIFLAIVPILVFVILIWEK